MKGRGHRFLTEVPQVVVMLPAAIKVCRDMRRGVLKYVRTHGPWALHLVDGRDCEQKIRRARVRYSGVIAQPITDDEVAAIAALRIPRVLVDPQKYVVTAAHRSLLAESSLIRCDTGEVGRFAARHFLTNSFVHFAYVGSTDDARWSDERGEAFVSELAARHREVSVFGTAPAKSFADELPALCAWLRALPKPCAVFCAWDGRARQVVDACAMAEIEVPSDVSILGVDDDDAVCESVNPPIPSVCLDAERAGYLAARHLDNIFRGIDSRHLILYGPKKVKNRVCAVGVRYWRDEIVRVAADFIALNAVRGATVADVAKRSGVSVRVLERRFAAETEMTVSEMLFKTRLDRVREMLAETREPIKSIAFSCGFGSVSHLTMLFRRTEGMTMTQYRAHSSLLRMSAAK